ncbi:uncharacterized protein EI97DRAFT_432280 [Westerdykella ornata]|uniref:Uncharacterized protein n=1 Tax=Westerdykella ornata TaxID=318751 RepID=A0A6A6JL61_WESOR|nr:uncharacterized protein EI97DRAFT_432280 [Westerdykella ornata]KAF2277400.1 hypothetical protein EI97DRAFT_432280 [Westerdykella ornata]
MYCVRRYRSHATILKRLYLSNCVSSQFTAFQIHHPTPISSSSLSCPTPRLLQNLTRNATTVSFTFRINNLPLASHAPSTTLHQPQNYQRSADRHRSSRATTHSMIPGIFIINTISSSFTPPRKPVDQRPFCQPHPIPILITISSPIHPSIRHPIQRTTPLQNTFSKTQTPPTQTLQPSNPPTNSPIHSASTRVHLPPRPPASAPTSTSHLHLPPPHKRTINPPYVRSMIAAPSLNDASDVNANQGVCCGKKPYMVRASTDGVSQNLRVPVSSDWEEICLSRRGV